MRLDSEVRIVDYESGHAEAFKHLNVEWLEKYFRVETVDELVLSDPEGEVLEHGGVILMALVEDAAVGTVALKHHGDGLYELTKMAVTEDRQGQGLGRRLMAAAVQRFIEIHGRRLYLESHSSLVPALHLYESAGFRHSPRPQPSDYERSDVYMVYRPD